MEKPLNGTEIQPLVTTRGRKTGKPHTVQIRIYYWNGRLIATSPYPRIRRDWPANVGANPDVTISVGGRVVRAKAKVLEQDNEAKENVAKLRISWRGSHCPIFEPEEDTFVEFFPEEPSESLFDEPYVTHSPSRDPLVATSLREIVEWQKKGNWYAKEARESR
jgi:deazaflavin-dependent oxidoreductase (nitroreductase family)